MQSIGVAHVTV